MTKRRVVVTGASFPAEVVECLGERGLVVETLPGDLDAQAVRTALDGAWGYVLGGAERMGAEVWAELPDLAVVCFLGTGYAEFLQLPDGECDTSFAYTPHANAEAVAEFTVALTLDVVRGVSARAADVAAGRWGGGSTRSLISGTVGIAGMGQIGQAVARMVSTAFGAQVSYWNRSARPELASAPYRSVSTIDSLCDQVDLLIVTLGYDAGDNDGVIGAHQLAALGPAGILVNPAAARLVAPDALRTALATEQLAMAAFDGYYQEPMPPLDADPYDLLRYYPRFIVTPHCAYATGQAMRRMTEMAAQNLLAAVAGDRLPYPIPARLAAARRRVDSVPNEN